MINNFERDNGEGSSSVLGKGKIDNGENLSNTKGKKKKAKNRNKPEKRAARFINTCNKMNKLRIERAMTQFLYLVDYKEINPTHHEFSVLGPTGHFFVFLKVLKINPNSYFIYQKALIMKELRFIFNKSPKIVLPNEKEIEKLKEIASIKRRPIDGNCSVCMEPLNNNKKLIWCQSGCGNNIHQDCFAEWTNQKVN
ncbi:hypothetical protein Glove_365g166 [Diversispora epigaea]|uniref:RING-type domain-containing protein n=1 Tax=Diversispora epigaea TaxID=1348612 RepID=A0A397HAT9_9GLOM|nr:hypothetical protein Glove_365g166 [Diversispora epigaea]